MAKDHVSSFRKEKILKRAEKELREMTPDLRAKKLLDSGQFEGIKPKKYVTVVKNDNSKKHGARQDDRRKRKQYEYTSFSNYEGR